MDRYTHGLRESSPFMVVYMTYRGISSRFSLASHLPLTVSEHLVYLKILPCVHMHLLAKMNSTEEISGWVDFTLGCSPLLFWPSRIFIVGKVSLTSGLEVYSVLSFFWAGLCLSHFHLGVQTPAGQPGAHLFPASDLSIIDKYTRPQTKIWGIGILIDHNILIAWLDFTH